MTVEIKEFADDHALTIFVDEYSANFLKNYTEVTQAQNQTLQTFFMQITYMNCEKLSTFIGYMTKCAYLYMMGAIYFSMDAYLKKSRI